jgi:hypothetical protein
VGGGREGREGREEGRMGLCGDDETDILRTPLIKFMIEKKC